MRTTISVALAAALTQIVGAQVVDYDLIYSLVPKLEAASPVPTTSDTSSIASSIVRRLEAAHAATATDHMTSKIPNKPLSTTKKVAKKTTTKRKAKTTPKKTPKRKTTANKKKVVGKKPAHKIVHAHAKRQQASSSTSTASASASTCVSQTILYTYVPTANDPNGFLTDTLLRSSVANNVAALAPAGWTRSFQNLFGSLYSNSYIGYYQQTSYNVSQCAALCSAVTGCQAINTYFERDPVVNPGANCRNPTAGVTVRCALWGSPVSAAQAVIVGEWRTDFMVVIQGSNGYNVNTPPPAQTNFTGPVALAGAIATSSGSSYIASSFQAGALDPSFCAQACQTTTQTNKAAAYASGLYNYQACNYFNIFRISYNQSSVGAGTYCKLYTDSSQQSQANQYTSTNANGTVYDLNYSYGYSLASNDSGVFPPGSVPPPKTTTASGSTATASAAPANLVASCSQVNSTGTFTDSNNILYNVKCSYDLLGIGDLSSKGVASFAACFAACDGTTNCNAIAYVGGSGSGTCYFKRITNTTTTQPNYNTGVDLAWLPGSYPGYNGTQVTR